MNSAMSNKAISPLSNACRRLSFNENPVKSSCAQYIANISHVVHSQLPLKEANTTDLTGSFIETSTPSNLVSQSSFNSTFLSQYMCSEASTFHSHPNSIMCNNSSIDPILLSSPVHWAADQTEITFSLDEISSDISEFWCEQDPALQTPLACSTPEKQTKPSKPVHSTRNRHTGGCPTSNPRTRHSAGKMTSNTRTRHQAGATKLSKPCQHQLPQTSTRRRRHQAGTDSSKPAAYIVIDTLYKDFISINIVYDSATITEL